MIFLLRGFIYRSSIKYDEIGTRVNVEITNQDLIKKIDEKVKGTKMDINKIVEISTQLTCNILKFTSQQTSDNPNELINSKQANCVGYSAMFNSISNYLILKHRLQDKIKAEHKIGQLKLWGMNLHQYVENPFFKDHDFNQLTNLKSGEKILVDPSLSDYLWINRIGKVEKASD